MQSIRGQKGFTLIEILVVIGLIAILAAIVLIAINPGRQFAQGRDTQRTSNTNAILNAIGQYTADNKGNLPAGVPAKPASGVAAAVEIPKALCSDIVPTYLPSLPTDPKSSLKGASISDCSTWAAGQVVYTVTQDSNGRITVAAPSPEIETSISVTR